MRSVRALVVALLLAPLAAGQVGTGASPLERARAALGRPGDPGAIVEGRGKAHASGLDGAITVQLAMDGAFRLELDSELPQAAGFDGKTVWQRDPLGLARAVELQDADRWKLLTAVLSGRWTDAPEVEARAVEGSDPPALELRLAGTPMEMTLALDPGTALPRTLVHEGQSGTSTWTFGEFVEIGGRKLPRGWTLDEAAGLDRYELEDWRVAPVPREHFRLDPTPPDDVRFDPQADPELSVLRVASGHLLVEARVEGEDVGLFVFDTGAGGMVIDEDVADELGLAELGEIVAVGVAGRTQASFRRGSELALGPLTLRDPLFVELDLGFLTAAFGRAVAGIAGYDVLARSVAEIETATPRVALRDPARFELAGASWQDLVLSSNTPCARARFEGEREGLFRLDTGAGGTVAFHSPAVTALGLLEGRAVTSAFSGGVGGAAAMPQGELEWFELAGRRFEKPRVIFSRAETGAFTDVYTTGNIGQGFLAPFRLVLDYPHDRLAFVPLAR